MNQVAIVTYKVLDGKAEENKKLIEAVFSMLKEKASSGVKYASVIGEDQLTFTHIAYFESDADKRTLTESIEFKEFQRNLKSRCEIPPQAKFCEIVETHNLFSS